jgi:hypothetical protein
MECKSRNRSEIPGDVKHKFDLSFPWSLSRLSMQIFSDSITDNHLAWADQGWRMSGVIGRHHALLDMA